MLYSSRRHHYDYHTEGDHIGIRAFQVIHYTSLGGLEAVLRDLYLTFSSFGHFSSLRVLQGFLVLGYVCDAIWELWGPPPGICRREVSSTGYLSVSTQHMDLPYPEIEK